jgi:hypothetical protein
VADSNKSSLAPRSSRGAPGAPNNDVSLTRVFMDDAWHAPFAVFNLFSSHAHKIDHFYPTQLPGESQPTYGIQFKPVEPISVRLTLQASF